MGQHVKGAAIMTKSEFDLDSLLMDARSQRVTLKAFVRLGRGKRWDWRGVFTKRDAWAGGDYELGLELGPRSDSRLCKAIMALWNHPTLEGCYLAPFREPSKQPRLIPGDHPDVLIKHLSGEITLLLGVGRAPEIGRGKAFACCSSVLRLEDGVDWIYLGVPLGSLPYRTRGYPMAEGSDLSWCKTVSEWLKSIAESVFEPIGFRLGMVGWELNGLEDSAEQIERDGIPKQRYCDYLWPSGGKLSWHPNNAGASITEFEWD